MTRTVSMILILVQLLCLVPSHAESPKPQTGLHVELAYTGKAAAKAGVDWGDILLTCDGQPLVFVSSLKVACLKAAIAGKKTVTLKLIRDGGEQSADVNPMADLGLDVRPLLSPNYEERWRDVRASILESYDAYKKSLLDFVAEAEKAGDYRIASWVMRNYRDASLASETLSDISARYASLCEKAGDEWEHAQALVDQADLAGPDDDYKAVIALMTRAVEIQAKLAPGAPQVLQGYLKIIRTARAHGDEALALEYAKTELQYVEEAMPGSPMLATMYGMCGILSRTVEDYEAARDYYSKEVELLGRIAPGGANLAESLEYLGKTERDLGNDDVARKHLQRALEIADSSGGDSSGILRTLGDIAMDEGWNDDARKHYERAVGVLEKLDPDSMPLASALIDLGFLCHEIGDFATARSSYERAVAIRERLDKDGSLLATALNNLASVDSDQGLLDCARDHLRRAVAIREKLNPDSLLLATTINNLGGVYRELGDWESARELYERALKIRELLDPDGMTVSYSLNSLGSMANDAADYKTARDYLLRALRIREKLEPDSPETANTLQNLGFTCHGEGDREAARDYYERALAILTRVQPDNITMSAVLGNLAALAWEEKDYSSVERYLDQSFAILEPKVPNSIAIAFQYMHYAELRWQQGRKDESVEIHRKSVDILRQCHASQPLAEALNRYGGALWLSAHNEEALPLLKEAVDVFESIRFDDLQTRERLLAGDSGDLYEDVIKVLIMLKQPDEALKYLERSKSKAVVDALNVSSIRTGNEALTSLLKRHADLQANVRAQEQQLSQEQAKPQDERNLVKIEQLTKLLAQTKAEFYQVVNQIRKDYGPEYSALVQVEPTEFSAVQKQLPKDAVVVEYFPAEDKLYIFIVTGDSFKVKEHAVTRDQLDGWVEQVRQAMDDWKNGLGSDTPPDALVSLYDNLIKPVEEEIAANKTVIFVPSGTLCYLPFTALAQKDSYGKLEYLVERDKQFVTLTQMGLLGKLLENEKLASEGRSVGAIAFGNPSGIKPALPNAENEVNAIAGIYPDSKPFTGDDATEWRVKLQAQYGRIVHLATHAMLRHDDPNESYIALMAGENEDGRLTGGEIFGLPLEGTMLVVLSACQTAVAEDNPGREISSLAQAFAIAGAPTVIASLWSVSDASTGKLMTELYRGLGQGKSKAVALRDAQRSLLADKEHSHPFFWASFTLLGAWE